jgi:Tfp pilus assembly PilM family ATPase
METPCLDVQILGPAPVEADEGGSDHIRVLFAAAPLSRRDLPIRALERAGLAPEVVDLEALAGLNAALATLADQGEPLNGHSGFGVLDLGSRATVLHATHTAGGVLSRSVGPTLPRSGAPGEMAPLLARIAGEVHETFMFFRGRYRRGLSRLYLAGGGARVVGVAERLSSHLNLPVEVLDPLAGRSGIAGDADAVRDDGPRFVTAFGLCRWWDAPHV